MIVRSELRSFCHDCNQGMIYLETMKREIDGSINRIAYVKCKHMPYCDVAVSNYEKECEEAEKQER